MKSGYAIICIGLVICVVIAYYNNAFQQWGYPAPGAQQPGTYLTLPRVPAPTGTVTGTFTMIDNAYNALNIATPLTIGADVTQGFWAFRGGWILLGAHGASGTNVEVTPADQGYIYVMMAPVSGQAFLADVARTIAMNARAGPAQFVDVNRDNLKEFMVQWNMANIPAARSGYPSTTFTGYYFADISGSITLTLPIGFATARATLKSTIPATTSLITIAATTSLSTVSLSTTDVTSATTTYFTTSEVATTTATTSKVATTTTTSAYSTSTSIATGTQFSNAVQVSYMPAYMTFGASATAVAVFKIEVKCNTTNTGKATLASVNVPGKGVLQAAARSAYHLTDSYQIWDFVIGNDLSNCLYWTCSQNAQDYKDLTFGVQTTLASGDYITWTVSVYMLTAAQAVTIASGSVSTSMP